MLHLLELILNDTLTDNAGNALTLTSGPTFTSATASSSQGTLKSWRNVLPIQPHIQSKLMQLPQVVLKTK